MSDGLSRAKETIARDDPRRPFQQVASYHSRPRYVDQDGTVWLFAVGLEDYDAIYETSRELGVGHVKLARATRPVAPLESVRSRTKTQPTT